MIWFLLLPFFGSIETTIHDFLLLNDPLSAEAIAHQEIRRKGDSAEIQKLYVESLAKGGKEKEMVKEWERLFDLDEEAALDRALLEKMAWGVIEKGSTNSSPPVLLISMLAALFSQDIQGVHLILRQLNHKNSLIRGITLQLAGMLGDQILKKPIIELYHREKSWDVKMALIKAIGQLKIVELEPELHKLISEGQATPEEKMVAIESLLNLQDEVTPLQIKMLVQSEKSYAKMIGCKLALNSDDPLPIELFEPLLHDSQSEVRALSLYVIGLLYYKEHSMHEKLTEIVRQKLHDKNPQVQVTALWLKTLKSFPTSSDWLHFLNHEKQEVRLFACALLPTLGERGYRPLFDAFIQTKDPFVKMNLALGLLKQNKQIPLASKTLVEALSTKNPLWMWKDILGNKVLAPTTHSSLSIDNPPLNIHRLCQIEILQTLSLFDAELAKEGVLKFLRQRNWELTGVAMALLLTECSPESAELVENLIKDPKFPHKIEALTLLAMWSQDPAIANLLEEEYDDADRKKKELLLEAMGKVGTKDNLTFLVNCLNEPFPMLRMIAASSIIQCLNR
ncbi:hypothetical protein N9Y92_00410 [Chlamydiales bacterium]|nr:hypothetical protein [Chlamydiales bacterium]